MGPKFGLKLFPMRFPCFAIFLLVSWTTPTTSQKYTPDEDSRLDPTELIFKYGYPNETHQAVSKDGYTLTLFRIPGGKNGRRATKGPILLMHGLLSSASDWLVLDQHKVFAYMLADQGYDVWLGNARGNSFNGHTLFSKTDPDYWKFSFHEMGKFDVPAVIDHILDKAKATKLTYVGHSMGCTMFFICMSLNPEYNQKIHKMIAFSPAIYLQYCTSPAKYLKYVSDEILLGYSDLTAQGRVIESHIKEGMVTADPEMCTKPVNRFMCQHSFFLLVGYNPEDANETTTARVVGHTPSDASMRSIVHYAQFMRKGKFRGYDHGYFYNIIKYGEPDPPSYSLDRVKVPVLVVYGHNDTLIAPRDVQRVIAELQRSTKVEVIDNNWNHLDFMYADSAPPVYTQCIEFMKK